MTSTPNGVTGDGEWFYKRWQNSVDSDLIFDGDKWDQNKDIDSIVNDPSKNTFIGIQYHWSEDPTKDEEWYKQQCQEIDDQRTINQELDLLFVGTQSCIFTDETLASFESEKPVDTIETTNGATLNLFEKELDPNDYYLIGCDTADSLEGAYCAIQIFSFKDFNQIGEIEHKYGSYTLFGQDIDFVFKWLLTQLNNDNIILCNENNTIGKAPIEYLVYHAEGVNYVNYLYKEAEPPNQSKNKKNKPIIATESGLTKYDKLGINTTGLTKPLMVGCLLECIKENSSGIRSQKLINQMSNIEKTNTGSVKSTGYSDLFMSACFCAYVRSKKAIEIMPMLQTGDIENYKEKQIKDISSIIGLGSTKNLVKDKQNAFVINDIEAETQGEIEEVFEDTEKQDFLPFFTM